MTDIIQWAKEAGANKEFRHKDKSEDTHFFTVSQLQAFANAVLEEKDAEIAIWKQAYEDVKPVEVSVNVFDELVGDTPTKDERIAELEASLKTANNECTELGKDLAKLRKLNQMIANELHAPSMEY